MLLSAILQSARQIAEVDGYGDGGREPGLSGRDMATTLSQPSLYPALGISLQQQDATKLDAADLHRR